MIESTEDMYGKQNLKDNLSPLVKSNNHEKQNPKKKFSMS